MRSAKRTNTGQKGHNTGRKGHFRDKKNKTRSFRTKGQKGHLFGPFFSERSLARGLLRGGLPRIV